MKFVIDLRFKDKGQNAKVHFLSFFTAKNMEEAQKMYDELIAGFDRRNVEYDYNFSRRIDNDPEMSEKYKGEYEHYLSYTNAHITIEQFQLPNPNQTKTLYENLVEKLVEWKFHSNRPLKIALN
jgi:hypothetical protein